MTEYIGNEVCWVCVLMCTFKLQMQYLKEIV